MNSFSRLSKPRWSTDRNVYMKPMAGIIISHFEKVRSSYQKPFNNKHILLPLELRTKGHNAKLSFGQRDYFFICLMLFQNGYHDLTKRSELNT